MAEAEDVIVDAARHATGFVQELWLRHRAARRGTGLDLPPLLQRLELLTTAALSKDLRLRIAQPPHPTPLLRRIFKPHEQPAARGPIPSTDGRSVWLPAPAPEATPVAALQELRLIVLQQTMRAVRAAPEWLALAEDPLQSALFELLEAQAADAELARRLPGLSLALAQFRAQVLERRPPVAAFPAGRRPLEHQVRTLLAQNPQTSLEQRGLRSPADSLEQARSLARDCLRLAGVRAAIAGTLYRDLWIGELKGACAERPGNAHEPDMREAPDLAAGAPRSARLLRRPKVREADERDERSGPGAWMVQTAQPHEHAEDPFGMQRPADRDEDTPAEELAESVSELAEARLVTTPGAPREVLLSDDAPPARAARAGGEARSAREALAYPEWDWRRGAYREPGALVHLLPASPGPREWITRTLEQHRGMLAQIRRQFESLRPQRVRLRQQSEGDELDIEACIDGLADTRAGAPLPLGLYEATRKARRELAALLLIDVSGSTDGWISSGRRVIDVERESLLLVCLAMQSLGEAYSVLAFSGEGPGGVVVRTVKSFQESYGEAVALRIAGLEPERYTRAGAAIRHASALLMREPAAHRLLLILSDGKPNDMDEYDGRYGVEDMRQAVTEARLQGIFPFCLTIDRHTASYLPGVFGAHQYAILHRPELLPAALLGWLRRLVQS